MTPQLRPCGAIVFPWQIRGDWIPDRFFFLAMKVEANWLLHCSAGRTAEADLYSRSFDRRIEADSRLSFRSRIEQSATDGEIDFVDARGRDQLSRTS
jgi:hypothetical protein